VTAIRQVTMSIRQRSFGWLPTVVVLAVVLIAGSRLFYLSVQHHAAAARETAATVATASVGRIEPLLQRLADLADRQAASAAPVLSNKDASASLASVPPAANTFWMSSDDKVLGARPAEAALQANGSRRSPPAAYLAPPFWVRYAWVASGS
jgi:cytoskeletal protein RodZ